MKTHIPLLLLLLCTQLFSPGAGAQMLSGNIFLKGRYVECAIAANGTLGSGVEAPAGYHSLSGGKSPAQLGLVVDVDKDGWDKGSPKWIGDFIMPGLPHEGWDIEVNGFTGRAMRSKGDKFLSFGLLGGISDYRRDGTVATINWSGSFGDIAIEKEIIFDTTRMYLLFNVKLINRGKLDLNKVYYQRTVDPDNEYEQVGGTGYATIQEIENCQPDSAHLASVSAKGHDYGSYIGLFTRDCRARPYYLKSSLVGTESLDSFYNGRVDTNLIQYKKNISYFYDVGMGVIFNIGTLKAGDSTYLTYAYIFEKTEQDFIRKTAFAPRLRVRDKGFHDGDTVYACNDEWLDLSIFSSGHDYWKWSTAFVDSLGRGNRIFVHGTMQVAAWRPYAASCGGGKYDSVRVTIIGTLPLTPILTRIGNTIYSPPGYHNFQWLRNGVSLGDSGSRYEIKYNGRYRLKAQDSNGCWSLSDEVVETGMSVSESLATDQAFEIYPNPSSGLVSIQCPLAFHLRVVNLIGQEVMQADGPKSVDMKSLVEGVYLFYLYRLDGSLIGTRRVMYYKE
jgi:hypothetical protein